MIFKLGELFCGPGGLGLAATKASIKDKSFQIKHVWATDYDGDSCETYRKNICSQNPDTVVQKDIRKLDYGVLMKISSIDALVFGFPCNDYSVVGEQKGMDGIFGPLYSYGVKGLEIFKPKWFLAENVGGLRNANEGKALKKILHEFHSVGYSLYPHLYEFDKYGVPQTRKRIIIVGIRKDINKIYRIPSPTTIEPISCRDAIENPPIEKNADNNEFTKQSPAVIERLKYIKQGENAFTADLPEHLQLNVKGARISQIYKRLNENKPSYTITGSGGGGTHVYHWSEPRALTNRERARLQTFPDDFSFCGSKESVRKQIGMSVPVVGARVIFESILKTFAGIEYDSIPLKLITPLMKNEAKK